jgi:hypothetical protein
MALAAALGAGMAGVGIATRNFLIERRIIY